MVKERNQGIQEKWPERKKAIKQIRKDMKGRMMKKYKKKDRRDEYRCNVM